MNRFSWQNAVMALVIVLCVVWLITGDGRRLEPLISLIIFSTPRFEMTTN